MRTELFDDTVSTDIEPLSSKFATEVSSKVPETKVSTPVTTVAEGEVSRSTTKTEDSKSSDIIKTTTKYPPIEDVTLIVTMEKDREEFETSSIQTMTEIVESTQKSKITSEVAYTETPLATKGGEVQDVTSNFTLPEIDITEQAKTKSATEQPTTATDILPTIKSIPSEMPETAIPDAHSISEDEDITSKLIFTESTDTKVSSVQTMEDIGIESTKEIMKETISDFFETEMSTLQPTKIAAQDEDAPTVHTTTADDIKTPSPTTAHVTEAAESHKTVSTTKAPQTEDKKQETTTVFTASTEQMEAETEKTETTLDEELEEFKLKLSSQFAPFSEDLDIETSSILPLETEYESTAISTELIESSKPPVSESPAAEEVKITKVEEPSEPSKISTSIATETSAETIHTSKHETTTLKLPTTSQEEYIVRKTTGSEITEVTTVGFTQPEETKKTEKPTTEISISAETIRAANEEELIKTRLTTLTEISATGDAIEKETAEVSVISEETILSNRTFAADAMLAHSTIAMSTITEGSQTKTEESTISDFSLSSATPSPSEESTRSFSTEGTSETTKTDETIFKETSSITEKAKQDYRTTLATLPSTRHIIAEADVSTEKLEATSEQTEVVTQFTSTSKEFISSPETDTDIDVATKLDTLHPTTLDSNITTYTEETPSDFKSISTISEAFPSQISTISAEEINETQMELDKMQTLSKLAIATERFTADITSIVSSTNVVFEETSSTSTVHTPTETVSEVTSQDQTSLDSISAVSLKDIKDVTSVIATTTYSETTVHESSTTTKSVDVLSERDTKKGETVTPETKLIKEEVASTLSLENGTIESSPAVSTSLEILGLTGKSTTADKTISTDIGDFSTSTLKQEITTKDDATRKTSLEDITESSQPEKITTSHTEMEAEKVNMTFDEFSSSATLKILTEGISEISTFGSTEIGEQAKSSVTKISTEVLAAEETTKVPDISKSTKFVSDEVTEKFITAETKAVEATVSVTGTYPEMTSISSTEMQILHEVTTPAGIFSEKEETDVSEFTSRTVSKEVSVDAEGTSVKLPVSTEIITESTAILMKTTSETKPDVKAADDVTMIWKTEQTSEAEESSKTVDSETTLALKTSSASDHFRSTGIFISEKPSITGVETTEMMVSTPLTRITEKTTESVSEEENITTIFEVIPEKEKIPTTVTSIHEEKVSEQTLRSSTDRISTTETAFPLVSKISVEDETSTDEKILSTSEEAEKRETGADVPIISTTDSRRFESTVKVTEPTSLVTESTSSTATTPYPEAVETEAIGVAVTTETSEGPSTKGLTEIEEGETVTESGCLVNGTMYGDGEAIDSVEPCEKCHCASGDVICFKVICKLPKAGCIPKTTSIDECCPSSYDCPTDGEKAETVAITSTLKVTQKDFTTPIPISFMFSSTPASIASTVLITKPSDQPLPEATLERKDYTTVTDDRDVSITTHVPTDTFLDTSSKTSERSAVTESTKYSTQEPYATATQSAVEEHSTTSDIRPGTPRFILDDTSTIASTATISESEVKTTIELTSTVPEFDVTQSEKLPHAVDLATEGPKADETSSLVAEQETKIIMDKVSTTQTTAYSDTDTSEKSKVVTFSGETVVTEEKAYPHSTTVEPTKEKEPEILTVTGTEIGNISQEPTKLSVTTIEMSDSYVTYKSTETTGYSEEQGTETELASATVIVSTKRSEDTTNKSIEIYDVKSSTISTTQITERDEVPKTTLKVTEIPAITDETGEKETLLKTTGIAAVAETITEKEAILRTTVISSVTDAATEKEIPLKPTGVPTTADTAMEKEIILQTTNISAVTEATTEEEIRLKPTGVPTTADTAMEKEIILKTTDILAVTEATTEEEIHLKPKDVSTVTYKTTEKDILLKTTAESDTTTGKEILSKTTSVSAETEATTEKEILHQATDVSAASDLTTEREILKTTSVSVITDEAKDKEVRFPVVEAEDRIISTTISDHTHSIPSETFESILQKESTKEMAGEEITPLSTALPSKLPKFDDFVTSTSRVPAEEFITAKSFKSETVMEAETTSKPSLKDVTTATKSDETEDESVSTDAIASTSSGTTVPTLSSEAFDSVKRNITDQMQSEVSDVTSTLSTLHPFISTTLTTVDLATSTDKEIDHVSVTSEHDIRKPTISENLSEKPQTQINETGGFDGILPTGDVFSAARDEKSTPAGSSTHASTLTAESSKVPMYIPSLIPQEIDSVTETAQINQTIQSLSKERLPTVSDSEITEEELSDISTETKISEKTTVSSTTTEKQNLETIKQSVIPKTASPTIGRDTEIQTTGSVEPSTTFDHVSATDKVFTFVSTRFTDVTTESIETETILATEHDISTLNVTDVNKKEELRNLTSSAATVSETSPLFETSTKIIFTTRKPALKSVDDSLPSVSPYDIDLTNQTEIQEQEELSSKSSTTILTPAITIYEEEGDLTKTDISLIEAKTSIDVIDESTTVHLAKDTFPTSTYDFTVPDKEISTSDERTSIAASIGASSVPTEETTFKEKSTVETTEVEKEISVSVSEQFTTYDHAISPKTSETQTEDKIYVANLTTLPEDIVDITFASDNETLIITTHRKFKDVTSAAEETTSSPYLKTSIPAISFTTFLDDLNATRKIADESLETISSKDAFETITAKASEQTSGATLTEKSDTITSDIRSTTPFISKVESSTIEKALASTEKTDVPTQTEITESTTSGREMSAKVSDITVSSTFVEDIVTEKLSDITKGATKIAIERTTSVPTIKDTTLEEESLVQNMSSVTTKLDIAADITAQSTTVQSKATTVHEVTEQARQDVTGLLTKAYKAIETTPTPFTVTAPTLDKEQETTAGIEMRKRLPFDDSAEVTDDLVYSTVPEPEDDFLLDEGSCIFEGRIYESAEQIPRADPCEFCFCFRGDIICLQQSCPPPAPNCHRTMIAGYCCPRYDCPVYMTSRNISSLSRRKGVQPIIIQRRIEKREIRPAIEVKGCQVNGTFYEVGSTVTSASGPCLHCMCQDGGIMRCDPQKCKPQAPLMLKMNNSFFRSRR
ncbi:mucin-17-like [Stegodyphus dumicola]|uniref:mucin-17-like n=1 Tax=Stegodyphus dumicola TaxID=202533 RepID=UPI0015B1C3A9|nr:mucin-17-like [Stegodyphus dumicola]